MTNQLFTHKFPEWQLDQALAEAAAETPGTFWHKEIVYSPTEPTTLLSLRHWFPTNRSLSLNHQRTFPVNAATKYGIDDDLYKKNYWGLRPDFSIEADDMSVLILIESKGGKLDLRTWIDPKELRYFQFLVKSAIPASKGLLYIVPGIYRSECERCLQTYFLSEPSIKVGLIVWEDLLEIIHDKLMGIAVDYILTTVEGIKDLRTWQRTRRG